MYSNLAAKTAYRNGGLWRVCVYFIFHFLCVATARVVYNML